MTQHRILATGQHRRQPPRLLPEPEMTDGVHTPVHPVQPPPSAAVIDRVLPEPQLTAGHHSVLTTRQGSQLHIRVH
jgi:hypothetical protein